jgi:PAS domain S-box-containing protein
VRELRESEERYRLWGVRALRESEERYRLLVEGVLGYAIVMLDPGGHVILWNAGAEKLYGYRADEIIGRDVSSFYPPDDVEDGLPRQELVVAASAGNYVLKGWRVRKDGSRFFAHVNVTPLRNEFGELRGFAKVTHAADEPKNTASNKDQR